MCSNRQLHQFPCPLVQGELIIPAKKEPQLLGRKTEGSHKLKWIVRGKTCWRPIQWTSLGQEQSASDTGNGSLLLSCSPDGKDLRVTGRADVSNAVLVLQERNDTWDSISCNLCEVTQLFIRTAVAAISCLDLGARLQGNYGPAGEGLSWSNKNSRDLVLKEKENLDKLELGCKSRGKMQWGKRSM